MGGSNKGMEARKSVAWGMGSQRKGT